MSDSTTHPEKVKNIHFDFYHFFAFLAPRARCGSNEYHVHRSEVNIYRVMTRNEPVVWDRQPGRFFENE